MINYEDYFGGLTEEEYVKQTEEHFKWIKEHSLNNFQNHSCNKCPNNPKNGGNGICNCILGQIDIT